MSLIIIGLVLAIALTIFFWAIGWNTGPNRKSGRPNISQFPSWAKWMMGLSWLPFVVILAVWGAQAINNQPSSISGVVTSPSITTPVESASFTAIATTPVATASSQTTTTTRTTIAVTPTATLPAVTTIPATTTTTAALPAALLAPTNFDLNLTNIAEDHSGIFSVTINIHAHAKLTNTGDKPAHNIKATIQAKAKSNGQEIDINNQKSYLVSLGDLPGKQSLDKDLSFSIQVGIGTALDLQNNGISFQIDIISDEVQKTFLYGYPD